MSSFNRVVFFQSASWLIVVLAIWIICGGGTAFSAFLGGFSCAIPSILAALSMKAIVRGTVSPLAFFLVEFFKVTTTILLCVMVAIVYKDLNWPAFLIGCGAVLFSHLFALAYRR